MILTNYQFRFSLLGTIMTIIGLSLFSGLGTWQVYRAIEKQTIQLEMDSKEKQQVILLDKRTKDLQNNVYLKVEAIGKYDQSGEVLIDNAIHNGKAGYHVITPFILKQDKSVIMVNRGWVPVGNDRSVLPELTAPNNEIKISGILSPPKSKPPIILAELDVKSKVWLYFDKQTFEKKLSKSISPVIILLDKHENNGYVRKWPKIEAKVGMHVGYAIQWYVFAIIVLVTYFGVNFKKRKIINE